MRILDRLQAHRCFVDGMLMPRGRFEQHRSRVDGRGLRGCSRRRLLVGIYEFLKLFRGNQHQLDLDVFLMQR